MESKSNIEKQLRELSKDEKAFKELVTLFESLVEQRDHYREGLDLLEAAIRSDYDSILITELDLEEPGPRIVYVNDGFTRMTGYNREEVLGKTPRILQGPKTNQNVLKRLKDRLKKGKSFFGQTVNYKKDGSEFVNQWDIHPLTDNEGNITHWVSYQHDITERKKAEKMLVDTQVDFDRLREETHRTVLDVDENGNIVMANKSFRNLTGYTKDELNNLKVWDLFPDKFSDSLKKRFDQKLTKDNFGERSFKGLIRHKTGAAIQISGETKVLDLQDRRLIRADITNISLQKKVMDRLQRMSRNFGRILDKASEFTYRLSMENGNIFFEYLSEEFPELTGLSPEIVINENGLGEFIHPDDLDKAKDHYNKALNGERCTCEYRIKSTNGDYISIIDYCKPVWKETEDEIVSARGAVSLKPSS